MTPMLFSSHTLRFGPFRRVVFAFSLAAVAMTSASSQADVTESRKVAFDYGVVVVEKIAPAAIAKFGNFLG